MHACAAVFNGIKKVIWLCVQARTQYKAVHAEREAAKTQLTAMMQQVAS